MQTPKPAYTRKSRYNFDSDSDSSSEEEEETPLKGKGNERESKEFNTPEKVPEQNIGNLFVSPPVFLTEVAEEYCVEPVILESSKRSFSSSVKEIPWSKRTRKTEGGIVSILSENEESAKYSRSSIHSISLALDNLSEFKEEHLGYNEQLSGVFETNLVDSTVRPSSKLADNLVIGYSSTTNSSRKNNIQTTLKQETEIKSSVVSQTLNPTPEDPKGDLALMDKQTKARIKEIQEDADNRVKLEQDQARVARQVAAGHMVKTEAAAGLKLEQMQSQLSAAQARADQTLQTTKTLQAELEASESRRVKEVEQWRAELLVARGALVRAEALQASRLDTITSDLKTQMHQAQDAKDHCAKLQSQLEALEIAEAKQRERADMLEKVSAGHMIKTEAMAEAKLSSLQTQLKQAQHAKTTLEQSLTVLKTESASKAGLLEEQVRRLASNLELSRAQATAPGVSRAQDLQHNLSELIANSWVVLCWRGKEPGQVIGRGITLYPNLKKKMSFAALAAIFLIIATRMNGRMNGWHSRMRKIIDA